MSGAYSIALNGLMVAQRAIELIGSNMANAATEGYHRQELILSPIEVTTGGRNILMAGPVIKSIPRMIDEMLEQRITSQHPLMGQTAQELSTLQYVESMFGELASEGLSTALGNFFGALSELSTQPDGTAWQNQVVGAAETLTSRFRNIASYLTDTRASLKQEAEVVIQQVNALADEIAQLNEEITIIAIRGGNANLLLDRRDQAINELSELVDTKTDTYDAQLGLVNVSAWGFPLVMGTQPGHLELGVAPDGELGVSMEGASYYSTDVTGGKLGGMMAVYNEILPDIQGKLDLLAQQVATQINDIHIQGIGPSGPFTELTGEPITDVVLDQWDTTIAAGSFYIRLTATDGTTTVHEVAIDPATDTVTDIANRIAALDAAHLDAQVVGSRLSITGLGGWKFDFVPDLALDASALTGTATLTVSGLYTGDANDTFTGTVVGDGDVGVTGGLKIEVRNGLGDLIATVNIGDGYPPGDSIDIGVDTGIVLHFSSGTVADGETFTIEVISDSDETGFLTAAGMNTFFSGDSAATIAVRDYISDDPSRLATSRTDGSGNVNVKRMAGLSHQRLSALGNFTMSDYQRSIAVRVGQAIAIRKARLTSMDQVMQQLINHRDGVSGVDINEEAAKLLVFERIFQAMSRLISVQNEALRTLMDVI